MKKHFLAIFSLITIASSLSCNPLDTKIPNGPGADFFTLRQLVQRACGHTCSAISVPLFERMAETESASEIVEALKTKLEAYVASEEHATTLKILKGQFRDCFSIEQQQREWDLEHPTYEDTEEGLMASMKDIVIEAMPDPDNGALTAYLEEENELFNQLEIAASHFSLLSPTSTSPRSSVSASPETPRRSPQSKLLTLVRMTGNINPFAFNIPSPHKPGSCTQATTHAGSPGYKKSPLSPKA